MTTRQRQIVDYYMGAFLLFLLRPFVVAFGKILRRDHSPEVRGKIVVLKLLGGGSLVLAFPTLLGLRRRYPKVPLVLVTTAEVRPFAEILNVFDEILVVNDRNFWTLLATAVRAWRRCLGTDTVIDLEVYSRLSTVFGSATLARNRVAFYLHSIFWRKPLSTHLIFFSRHAGVYWFYEQVGHLLGAPPVDPPEAFHHVSRAANIPPLSPSTLCIGFSCSDFGKERELTPAQWEWVVRRHWDPENPKRLVLLGAARDRTKGEMIAHTLRASHPNIIVENRAGQMTLSESAALLWSAGEFWGIDSGLLHLARLGAVPCLSFWGPTDPGTRLKPWTFLKEKIFYNPIPCSPCIHVADEPPCRGDNRCMKGLFGHSPILSSQELLFTTWPPRAQEQTGR